MEQVFQGTVANAALTINYWYDDLTGGTYLKEARDVARPWDINLPMSQYSHAILKGRAKVLDLLPAIIVLAHSQNKAGAWHPRCARQ